MTSWRTLIRWMRESDVSGHNLLRSLAASTVAYFASHALAIGAPLLLFMAWSQRDWGNPLQRIAIPLVIIEIVAFLRSPLRYVDRMNAHRLGVTAVTKWRQWLTEQVSRWTFRAVSATSRANLMQQSVVDVDSLQNLWLRVIIPLVASLSSYLITVSVVIALTARYVATSSVLWLIFGVVAVTLLVLSVLASCLERVVSNSRLLRHERAVAINALFGRQQLAHELTLLQAPFDEHGSGQRSTQSQWRTIQTRTEDWWRRVDLVLTMVSSALLVVAGFVTATLALHGPSELRVVNAGVVGVLVAAISSELFTTWRNGLEAAADIVLTTEDLATRSAPGTLRHARETWPTPVTHYTVPGVLSFTPGQMVAVVGPSGSGKSTWLREIAQLDVGPGSLFVNETSLATIPEEELRDHVIHVATEPRFLGTRIADEMTLGSQDVKDFGPIVSALKLAADASIRPSQSSRGERHRYAIARALVRQPELLLLDEPTAGLGDLERAALIEVLRTQQCTVLIATHDPTVIEQCDHVVTMDSLKG